MFIKTELMATCFTVGASVASVAGTVHKTAGSGVARGIVLTRIHRARVTDFVMH